MAFSLILDILIAVLLVFSIGYTVSLNRRLTALRQDKDELESLTSKFSEATGKAEASIQNLRGSTDEIASALNKEIEKAESIRDDLTFLVDRGASVADRLESGVREKRNELAAENPLGVEDAFMSAPSKPKGPPQRVPDPADEGPDARAKAQQELLKALQSMS
ncbi:MAG: DUF6468 domain-containing protein [Alphaproteobacteria bacterium]|nr:DUF6468 domain-containing protein [Rhodospirillales bacterium]MCW9046361.1 DUF6468 domain-containing protein [Alphaproteobacteria bacterium]